MQSALPGNVFARTALPFVLAAAAGCSVQALAADAATRLTLLGEVANEYQFRVTSF